MSEKIFVSHSEIDTRRLGFKIGKNIMPGVCVLLHGDMGAGKTVLVRGAGRALGISGVRSPSFTLINEYESDSGILVAHADLYRLDDASSLGLEEYEDAIMFVEWPECWKNPPSNNVLEVFITNIGVKTCEIKIIAQGEKAEGVLMKL